MTLSNLFAPLKPENILKYSAYFALLQISFFVFVSLMALVFKYQFPSSDPFSFSAFQGNIFHLCSMIGQCFLLGIFYSLRNYPLPIKKASRRLVSCLFLLSSTCIALTLSGSSYYDINRSGEFAQIQQRQAKHYTAVKKEYTERLTPFQKAMFWTSIIITLLGTVPYIMIPISCYFIMLYSGYILLKSFLRTSKASIE